MWKSDNQEFKEDTFIQMGRGGTDSEMGREVWRLVWHGEAAAAAEKTVPHSCVVDKNWERYFGCRSAI